MTLPFRLFAGGRLGDGRQWMSWISAVDLLRVYRQALEGELTGPVNAVAPGAVRNEEFTRVLARVLHRPAVMVVPSTALRLAYGQMADEAILASTHVLPTMLQASGFEFEYPSLGPALTHLLGPV